MTACRFGVLGLIVCLCSCVSSPRSDPAASEQAVSREKILIHVLSQSREPQQNFSLAWDAIHAAYGARVGASHRNESVTVVVLLDMPLQAWMVPASDQHEKGPQLVRMLRKLGEGSITIEWASRGSMPRDLLPPLVDGISVVEFPVDRITELVSQGYIYVRM